MMVSQGAGSFSGCWKFLRVLEVSQGAGRIFSVGSWLRWVNQVGTGYERPREASKRFRRGSRNKCHDRTRLRRSHKLSGNRIWIRVKTVLCDGEGRSHPLGGSYTT